MKTPRQYVDGIWGTNGVSEESLKEFIIPLSSAIGMIESYSDQKNQAIRFAIETLENYYMDGGVFYGNGLHEMIMLLKNAQ